MHIQANYSLKQHNTFQVDVKSSFFIEITKQSDIPLLRTDLKLSAIPWLIMGGGSNLLLSHDLKSLIIRCGYNKIKLVKEDDENVWLSVGAGLSWHELVKYTVKNNWWGLENLALIPGTVGAAPVQNIGAYGAEARDAITRVQCLNIFDGSRIVYRNAECNFGYRTSIFKEEFNNQLLVFKVTFKLRKEHSGRANLVYDRLRDSFSAKETKSLTPRKVFDRIVSIREKWIPNHITQPNAGSFFKNPVITDDYFNDLIARFPDIPHHKTVKHNYKIPAAWLIESAGWKGRKLGAVGVSNLHALVIVNYDGKGSGQDILTLSSQIQEDVDQKFGIHLEPEVIIL